MGRKRLTDLDRKKRLGITVKNRYILYFKEREVNISQFCEEKMKEFIDKNEENCKLEI